EPRFTESYRFHVEVYRRVRLWIDDKLIIDQWKGEGGEYTSDPVPLTVGKKSSFKLECSRPHSFMLCRVPWSSNSQGRATVPADASSTPAGEQLKKPILGM